jgi:hypothetical protein
VHFYFWPAVAPVFAQVWFHDPEFGNNLRCERDPAIDRTTLGELTEVLQLVNPYIDLYKTAREQLVTMESHTGAHASLTAELALAMEPGADRRHENLPTTSEVAAIVPDVSPDGQPSRDLQLTLCAGVASPCSGSRRCIRVTCRSTTSSSATPDGTRASGCWRPTVPSSGSN